MRKTLGAFDNDDLDRNDLNKCPDCSCFFPQDNCPVCGKPCPPEMRAGNRKAQKKKKQRHPTATRMGYMEWYYKWWAIALAMLFFPIIGIILLLTSPHKTSHKVIFAVVAIIYGIISTIGIGNIFTMLTNKYSPPIDTSLSQEEYIEKCKEMSGEDFYRSSNEIIDEFVTLKLIVVERFTDPQAYHTGERYDTYYVCRPQDVDGAEILIRDCRQDSNRNYIKGDLLKVYGECQGDVTVYDMEYKTRQAPCINAAFILIADTIQ